ncbi:capsule biosynthesis protein capA [alpha proteobacterium U9-1i]|nr:capsule biosynthesis protein capA [alpha proteobacterium U9-1i]
MADHVLIGLAGDILIDRANPDEVFAELDGVLHAPDIMFANLECAYSNIPRPPLGAPLVVGSAAHNLSAVAKAGFKVVAMATNHMMDFGAAAMLETRDKLRAAGVQTCGAGASDAEARAPALINAQGLRIAFLGYASVFPFGYEAGEASPGIAPVRSYNFWREQFPGYYLPGTAPRLTSVPDEDDFAKLRSDIERARGVADLVVASFHWGDFGRPFHLTDHEKHTARFCIDHGADLVVGHHHHCLRGMEWYKGKPVLYGLGHLVADIRTTIPEAALQDFYAEGGADASYRMGPREGWPLLPLHKDSRMTLVAWARGDARGFAEIGFLPCQLTPEGVVAPLSLASEEGLAVLSYMDTAMKSQKLAGTITRDGLELAGYQTARIVT